MAQLSQKDMRFDGDMSLVEDSPHKCKGQCLIATLVKEDQCGEDNRSVGCELDLNDTIAYGMDEFDEDFSNLNLDQSCQTMEDSTCDPQICGLFICKILVSCVHILLQLSLHVLYYYYINVTRWCQCKYSLSSVFSPIIRLTM